MLKLFRERSLRVAAIVGVSGAILSFVSVVIATVLLEIFALRRTVDGGLLNTMFPGFVYACVAILKLLLLAAPFYIGAGVLAAIYGERRDDKGHSRYALAAHAICVVTPIVGAATILIAQNFYLESFGHTSQTAVIVMFPVILAVIVSLIGVVKRESPTAVSVVSLLLAIAIALSFVWFEFYKFGFDQDRWANI